MLVGNEAIYYRLQSHWEEDVSHTDVGSYNSLAGQTLTWEARESLARETNHTTHQHTSYSASTPQ